MNKTLHSVFDREKSSKVNEMTVWEYIDCGVCIAPHHPASLVVVAPDEGRGVLSLLQGAEEVLCSA